MTTTCRRIAVRADLRLAVRSTEPDGGVRGRPVVLLHGLASNMRLWDGVARDLAAAGHPVHAVDQRGHGRSDKPHADYDMATVVDDLRLLLDALHLDAPIVVGQSWGGNVAVEAGASLGGRIGAVVGVDGGTIELAEQFDDWESCRAALRPPPLAGTPAERMRSTLRDAHPDWSDEAIAGSMANFDVRDDGTVRPWLTLERHLAVLAGLWAHRPSQRWAEVTVPTALVMARPPSAGGSDDSWTQAKRDAVARALDRLPDGTAEWLTGDHDLHAQRPRSVSAVIHTLESRILTN